MTLFSIDISNNNGSGISMAEVKAEGFAWVEAKVSEGNYFQDRTWPGYRDAANAAGIPIVGYHYAIASCSPVSQVAAYVNNGGGKTVMLDFEANSGTINDYWNLVNAFNNAGVEVVLSYIPRWYWGGNMGGGDLSKVPGLISSSYFGTGDAASNLYNNAGGDGGNGWNSYGGGTPVVWQFTDGANVAGVRVDANAFKGTEAELAALLSGGPAPTPVPVVNEIDAKATDAAEWIGDRVTRGEATCPDGVGKYAQFTNGYIYWHPLTGAHTIPNSLFAKYAVLGWEAGALGYPAEDNAVVKGGECQDFQHGVLYHQDGKDVFEVHGAIGDAWAAAGWETSKLGWPTSDERVFGDGTAQDFENGTVYWSPTNVVAIPKG